MSVAVTGFKFNQAVIETLDGSKKVDITNSILFADYFEDILSPCVTMTIQLMNSSSLFNILPIRGGERISISLETVFGRFELDGNKSMYVYKVGNIMAESTNEMLTLHLVSREGLTNETNRCLKRYEGNIKDTVIDILDNVLMTDKYEEKNIEKTANSYVFIGNQKKPFHILTWLCPKSVPASTQRAGTQKGNNAEAKGVAGFLFFENQDGFNFRSMESLVAPTQIEISSSDKKDIQRYIYTQKVIESNVKGNERKILNYNFEKNIDLMKSLRVGMYSNKTYFFDLYENRLDAITYKLKDQIQNKLGINDISVSKEFGDSVSRVLVRTSDRGVLPKLGLSEPSGRDNADMAKSFSRYNLLFTQALNMVVPCNPTLKVGDIIYAEFPRIERSDKKQIDEEQSGNYLIKELRHHFEGGQLVTSLILIRDSYGLYGSNNVWLSQ